MRRNYTDKELYETVLNLLEERNVSLESIAELTYNLQEPYNPTITLDYCLDIVKGVLKKREIQHAILVGIELDRLTEQGLVSEPLRSIIASDDSLFGVDETIALGGCYGYGSIALTTFGFLDKNKPGIVGCLDSKTEGKVNTFLDDLVAMVASNASGKVAHNERDREELKAEGE